jgi:3-oxoacyl-(acyl-carrier-protein) synthase
MIYLSDYRLASTTTTQLLEDIKFPQVVNWFPETYEKLKTGLFYVPHRVAQKVLDNDLAATLRDDGDARTAFILASGSSNFAGINPLNTRDNFLKYEYKFLPLTLTNVYAGRTAQMFGTKDHVATDATACASGMKVMMDVQTLMRYYGFDRVVVLAIEDQVSNLTLDFFGESQASLAWKDEKEGMKPSAFDQNNFGFHVGQGAALAVFENEATIKRRGITPKARLLGAYTASEVCANAIGQSDNGEGFAKAAKGALDMAGLSPECVAVIKTHGTGTKSNNRAEKCAIDGLFKDFVATSYKQVIGHTMGVSGLLETCMLIDNMNSGFVPAIPNRTQEDDVYLSHDIEAPKGAILSLAAGMGNVYSAAVLTTEL